MPATVGSRSETKRYPFDSLVREPDLVKRKKGTPPISGFSYIAERLDISSGHLFLTPNEDESPSLYPRVWRITARLHFKCETSGQSSTFSAIFLAPRRIDLAARDRLSTPIHEPAPTIPLCIQLLEWQPSRTDPLRQLACFP